MSGRRFRLRSGELVIVSFAVLILGAGLLASAVPPTTWPALGAFVLGFGLMVVAVRMMLAGVIVRGDGIIVRNPLGSHVLGWGEVASFSLRRPSAGALPRGFVETTDGRVIWIWGIRVGHAFLRPLAVHDTHMTAARAETLIGRLNAHVEAAREA